MLKTNGVLAITFIPALEPRDEVPRRDKELQEHMYKSVKRPKFFLEKFFLQLFERHGTRSLEKSAFETPKSRLSPQDAKRFLEWGCKNYRDSYATDVGMRSYEEILRKFRVFIEKYGVREMRSKFVLLVGKKSSGGKENLCCTFV